MKYNNFLQEIIDSAIVGVHQDNSKRKDEDRKEASLFGLEQCRGKSPDELRALFLESVQYCNDEIGKSVDNGIDKSQYWWFKHYQSEIEWICNVVSAVLCNLGHEPLLPHQPTGRAYMKAAEILGVRQ